MLQYHSMAFLVSLVIVTCVACHVHVFEVTLSNNSQNSLKAEHIHGTATIPADTTLVFGTAPLLNLFCSCALFLAAVLFNLKVKFVVIVLCASFPIGSTPILDLSFLCALLLVSTLFSKLHLKVAFLALVVCAIFPIACLCVFVVGVNTIALINVITIQYMVNHWTDIDRLMNYSVCGLPMYILHGGSKSDTTCTSTCSSHQTRQSSSSVRGTKRTIDSDHRDNCDSSGGEPPKKRGRPSAYHLSQACSPCSIWLQTGRDTHLVQHHRSNPMVHPGKSANAMAVYVSQPGCQIILKPDSCVCKGCDLDFKRNHNNSGIPRWVKVRDDTLNQKHCILCCTNSSNCQCARIEDWGPSTWHGDQSIEWWGKYFVQKDLCRAINPLAMDMCRLHVREFRRCLAARECLSCSTAHADKWFPTNGADNELLWLCEVCETCNCGKERMEEMLERDKVSENRINKIRAETINGALSEIKENTYIYTLPLVDRFKEQVGSSEEMASHVRSLNFYMDKYLTCNSFKLFCGSTRLGKLYYDERVHTMNGIERLYKVVVENYKLMKENTNLRQKSMSINDIKKMINDQCNKYPTASTFDYRSLVDNGILSEDKLQSYFNPELLKFIDEVTKSKKSGNTSTSQLYSDMRKLRLISLMCYAKNPSVTFMQTIIGLFCYAYGLRDKGFEILNFFGCSCSVDHVRRHGDFWSSHRSVMDELDVKKLWRISFDNLNFKIKYSVCVPTSNNYN